MTKSIEFKDKNNNTNNNNNNNNLTTNTTEKNKNIFFKIYYNCDHNLYYLIDMKVGYGTFYKIEEKTIIYISVFSYYTIVVYDNFSSFCLRSKSIWPLCEFILIVFLYDS